jgi:fatty acid desaturase
MNQKLKQIESRFAKFRQLNPWRSSFEILYSYFFIAVTIAAVLQISWRLYPLAIIIIGNRIHALALLGHEATHGTLYSNTKLNTWVGRYLCHFPATISHHRYKVQHLLHHRFLGSIEDPDIEFYRPYPNSKIATLRELFVTFLTGRMTLDFWEYYNGFRLPWWKGRNYHVVGKSDQPKLLGYWLVLSLIAVFSNNIIYLLLFWFVPLFCWLPWLQFKVAIEHAPIAIDSSGPIGKTRTILTHPILEKLLFPFHINYHSEHHLFPWVPHYNLPQLSFELTQLEKQPDFAFLKLRQMKLSQGTRELWINADSATKCK